MEFLTSLLECISKIRKKAPRAEIFVPIVRVKYSDLRDHEM